MTIRLNLKDGDEINIIHKDNPSVFFIIKAEKGKILHKLDKNRLTKLPIIKNQGR